MSGQEEKREREVEGLFGEFLKIVPDLFREDWKRTLDSLRELANEARKNGHRNEEDREEAVELLRLVVRRFLDTSGKGYDFEVHFDKYLELYDKEFNEIIGNYTHLRLSSVLFHSSLIISEAIFKNSPKSPSNSLSSFSS